MKWLCSLHGIEWKQLLGIQTASLETLMSKAGLRYQQDHNARADAYDLKCVLAGKHKGRTYLGRLPGSARGNSNLLPARRHRDRFRRLQILRIPRQIPLHPVLLITRPRKPVKL